MKGGLEKLALLAFRGVLLCYAVILGKMYINQQLKKFFIAPHPPHLDLFQVFFEASMKNMPVMRYLLSLQPTLTLA